MDNVLLFYLNLKFKSKFIFAIFTFSVGAHHDVPAVHVVHAAQLAVECVEPNEW
jgi:hypothetical protein